MGEKPVIISIGDGTITVFAGSGVVVSLSATNVSMGTNSGNWEAMGSMVGITGVGLIDVANGS